MSVMRPSSTAMTSPHMASHRLQVRKWVAMRPSVVNRVAGITPELQPAPDRPKGAYRRQPMSNSIAGGSTAALIANEYDTRVAKLTLDDQQQQGANALALIAGAKPEEVASPD